MFSACAAFALILALGSKEFVAGRSFEIQATVLAITLGLSFMAMAFDLLMILLSVEMVSILSYVLVGSRHRESRSTEGALKYLVYGAVASGIMAYGASYLYGITGSTSLALLQNPEQLTQNIASSQSILIVGFSFICLLVGIGYKVAIFPVQAWSPDAYEGAPNPVTAFLSVAPKAAGMALLIRVFYEFFATHNQHLPIWDALQWPYIVSFLAVLTMFFGNLGALVQTSLKRLMAYSSIAHAGYLLMGLAVFNQAGVEAILFYLIAYFLMNFGAFIVIQLVVDHHQTDHIDLLHGLGRRQPILAGVFCMFLFSLIGLPPFMGFVAKFLLFAAVLQTKMYGLAIFAVINAVISLFYYARLMKIMFFEASSSSERLPSSTLLRNLLFALAIPTLIFGLYWRPVYLPSLHVEKITHLQTKYR